MTCHEQETLEENIVCACCSTKLLLWTSIAVVPTGYRDGMRGFRSCLVVVALVGTSTAAAQPEDEDSDDLRSTRRRTLVGCSVRSGAAWDDDNVDVDEVPPSLLHRQRLLEEDDDTLLDARLRP